RVERPHGPRPGIAEPNLERVRAGHIRHRRHRRVDLLARIAEESTDAAVTAFAAIEELVRLLEHGDDVAIERPLLRQLIAERLAAPGVTGFEEQPAGHWRRPARLTQIQHREAVGDR